MAEKNDNKDENRRDEKKDTSNRVVIGTLNADSVVFGSGRVIVNGKVVE